MSKGDGMADVTEADREKAWEVADEGRRCGVQLLEAMVIALAEEREKERAPFLALADELEDQGHRFAAMRDLYSAGLGDARIAAADHIRRAAEVTE